MGDVVSLARHVWVRCTRVGCSGCSLCEGGLSLCAVCGGAEAALPTDCPGRAMTVEEMDDVSRGRLDYRRRRGWVCEPSATWSY